MMVFLKHNSTSLSCWWLSRITSTCAAILSPSTRRSVPVVIMGKLKRL